MTARLLAVLTTLLTAQAVSAQPSIQCTAQPQVLGTTADLGVVSLDDRVVIVALRDDVLLPGAVTVDTFCMGLGRAETFILPVPMPKDDQSLGDPLSPGEATPLLDTGIDFRPRRPGRAEGDEPSAVSAPLVDPAAEEPIAQPVVEDELIEEVAPEAVEVAPEAVLEEDASAALEQGCQVGFGRASGLVWPLFAFLLVALKARRRRP